MTSDFTSFTVISDEDTFSLKSGYVGHSESKYRLRTSLADPRDSHFAHVQWLLLWIEKPQTPFREIRVMFMFGPVR